MIKCLYPAFILETDKTSYIFEIVHTGHPAHLYYGQRIDADSLESLDPLREKRQFEPGNTVLYQDNPDESLQKIVPEDMCLEMSGLGKGDIREPFIELVRSDGSRTCDFVYEKYVIDDKAPVSADLPRSYSDSGKVEHLCLTLRDADLTLELHYCVYPECDVITRSAKLINGSDRIELLRLMSTQLDLFESGYDLTTFHGAWGREMNKYTSPLFAGKIVTESRAGCSSNRANPFFMLHSHEATEEYGDVYGFNLIYSGNHYSAAEVNAYGKTRVVSGIQPQGARYVLYNGESFETPEAVMTYSAEGFAGQSKNMHGFVRDHIVRGEWRDKERPVLLNSWEASYFSFNERGLLSLAKSAKELGVELFVLDDGWFGERNDDMRSLGDWDPNPKKLPGGLKSLC